MVSNTKLLTRAGEPIAGQRQAVRRPVSRQRAEDLRRFLSLLVGQHEVPEPVLDDLAKLTRRSYGETAEKSGMQFRHRALQGR